MFSKKKGGGLGLRSLHDLSKILFAKLGWNFKIETISLWGRYMWNKYCKKTYIPFWSKGKEHHTFGEK